MRQLLLPCEDETVEFRSYFPLFAEMVEVVLHSANVRANGVRLLSLGALRHHYSDCLSAATYGRWIFFAVRAHPLATLLRKAPRVIRRGT